jgi:predicted RNase H-like nuclease (RuvC/YqgF family)
VKDLRSQLSESQATAANLVSQTNKLSATIDDLQRENSLLSARNSRLMAENTTLRSDSDSQLREYRSKIADLTSRAKELEDDNSALLTTNRELRSNASTEELDNSLADTQQKLDEVQRKNDKLIAQVSDRIALKREVEELTQENRTLRDKMARKNAESDSLLDDLNSSRAIIRELERSPGVSALIEERDKLRSVVDVLTEENANLRRSRVVRSSPPSPSVDLQYRLENQDLRRQVSVLELERSEKEVENERLRTRCARLSKLNSSSVGVKDVYQQLRSENDDLFDENLRLKQRIFDLRNRDSLSRDDRLTRRSPSPPRRPFHF